MRNPLRHQLASTSPIPLGSLLSAVVAPGGDGDPREALADVLREAYGAAHARLTGSGTEALVLALRSAERLLGEEARVAWPAFSCYDLVSAAVRFGRSARFYDVDPSTLGPDLPSLERALGAGSNVVVIAPLFGIPIDWDVVDPLLIGAGALVIEDAAQGHGARWRDRPLGTHGRLGVLSFARGKGWTGGSGGALLVRSAEDVAEEPSGTPHGAGSAEELKVLLRAGAHWALGRPGMYGLPRAIPGLALGETRYHEVGEPRPMPRRAAALALSSRPWAERLAAERRLVAREWDDALAAERPEARVRVPEGSLPGYVRYPVVLPRGMSSFTDPRRALALGASPSYPRPLPLLDEARPLSTDRTGGHAAFPGATALSERLVTLPTHHLTEPCERLALLRLLGLERPSEAPGPPAQENR